MSMITFETKCWEKDWQYIINGGYEEKLNPFNGYKFNEKLLFINNVLDKKLVCREADKLKEKGVIDNWYLISDYEKEVLNFFELNKNSFIANGINGYYYSISELVSIYLSKSKYILHFSSDSIFMTDGSEFLCNSLNVMETDNKVVCITPYWSSCKIYSGIQYFCRFSDQCYLLNRGMFKNLIFNTPDRSEGMFPKHGGNSFECKVFSYLKNNYLTQFIGTDYDHYYLHYNNFSSKN